MSAPDRDEQYQRYRFELIDAIREACREFDKAILGLSSGTLALSIGFVREFAPTPSHKPWLMAAWALLLVAVVATLTSFKLSHRALHNHLVEWDTTYREDSARASRRWSLATEVANYMALVTFVLGVGCLAFFQAINL